MTTAEKRVEELEAEVERLRARLIIEECARWGGEVGDGLPAVVHIGYVFKEGQLIGIFHHPNVEAVGLKMAEMRALGYEVRSVRYIRVEAES